MVLPGKPRDPTRWLASSVLILAGILAATPASSPRTFIPFGSETFPQRAAGDFDGDGRPDVALIQGGADGSHVLVRLSGGSGNVTFDANVVSLIATDIDNDGDTDLVGAAPSGQVMVWLNDGRGRFTPQDASPSHGLSAATIFVAEAAQNAPSSLAGATGWVAPGASSETAIVTTEIRAPTDPPTFDLAFLSLPSLRAPPLSIPLG